MSQNPPFNFRDWLVPPILVPIFFALVIGMAMFIQR
jgi:hypothetical protein